jgi:hypothetical protein
VLRALGVTAQLDIERFRRMAIVAPGAMAREDGHFDRSPPLEAYLQALELFAETFKPAGGLRLLRAARPAILFYGLYNPNQLEEDQVLLDLIMVRGTMATIFDGLFPSNSARGVVPQVLLDMLLLELDRGIDLLALGANPKEKGPTEWRAVAFWLIANVIHKLLVGGYAPDGAAGHPIANFAHDHAWFASELTRIEVDYKDAIFAVPGLKRAFSRFNAIDLAYVPAGTPVKHLKGVGEELRVQESLEERWQNLVRTIAPEAGDQHGVFTLLRLVIEQAKADAAIKYLPREAPPLPPQFEQSLATIARRIS